MATGWGPTAGNAALTATLSTYTWVKLHVGDPGSTGVNNPAAETTRQQVSVGAAAAGSISSNADLSWTNVTASEDYTHFTVWTASSGGTFGFSGTITAPAVTAGATFTIASGNFSVTVTLAS